MKENENIIDIVNMLRHARHEWMNQLQLIKGNLELNNIVRAKEVIDDMIFLAQQESKLSNLKLPNFAEQLITFTWKPRHFKLDYEVLHTDMSSLLPENQLNDQQLTKLVDDFFEQLDGAVDPMYENHLTLSIEIREEKAILVFDFYGQLKNNEALNQFFSSQSEKITVHEQSQQLFVFELTVALS